MAVGQDFYRGGRNGWLAAVRLCHPEWMVRVAPDKVLNLPQTLWKCLSVSPACVVHESKASKPKGTDFGPLLAI